MKLYGVCDIFLSATRQIYECPLTSVCLSVCLSVRLSVCLSVYHTLLTMLLTFDQNETYRVVAPYQK